MLLWTHNVGTQFSEEGSNAGESGKKDNRMTKGKVDGLRWSGDIPLENLKAKLAID